MSSRYPPQRSDVALVLNDPIVANDIIDLNVPVVYVDSVPYMRRTEPELPALEKLACYCARKSIQSNRFHFRVD